MGISKIGPNLFSIKARVKIRPGDPRLPVSDRRAQIGDFKGTRAQAEEKLLEMKRDLRGERSTARIFGDVLLGYRDRRGEIPRSEISVYNALAMEIGPVELSRLKPALQTYFGYLRRTPSKTTGALLTNASINRRRAMVAASLKQAKQLGDIGENPLENPLVWPKLPETPRDRDLTPQETARLLVVIRAEAPHLEQIFWYALRVPCRKAELVDAESHHLDLINNLLWVPEGDTKNGDGCWKPIPEEMRPYFRTLPPGVPFVFFKVVKGKYRRLGDFKKSWSRCLRLAGIENFRFHDTRHIAASNLILAGMSEREVMDIAGWKTNMMSTYWCKGRVASAKRAKFLPADALLTTSEGNSGATSEAELGKSADSWAERAVS